jgi:pimeloyl-ACP methyl ester carboxylesterase
MGKLFDELAAWIGRQRMFFVGTAPSGADGVRTRDTAALERWKTGEMTASEPPSPASLVLVHGAGSGPWVYQDWPETFPSLCVDSVDLQEGLEVSSASMDDYAERVVTAARALPQPVSLCGWSMGGLVVLQAAERVRPYSVILIEASPPGEVQGFNPEAKIASGTFDPEVVYGAFPSGAQARPESLPARAERKRGISVPSLPCPSLVIYGHEFPDERGTAIARLYGSNEREFPGLDHWDLVRDESVREAIAGFLGAFRPVGAT